MPTDPKPRVDKDGLLWCQTACPFHRIDENVCEAPNAIAGYDLCTPAVRTLAATAARRLDLLGEVWNQHRNPRGDGTYNDGALSTLADVQAELTAAGRINEAGMFPGEERNG